MSEPVARGALGERIEAIEAGYEYLLAYAAQGRPTDEGSNTRDMLAAMHAALKGLADVVRPLFSGAPAVSAFLDAVERDAGVAAGAIALVLARHPIPSALIDNLNASIHLRALLTDLFLIDQALKTSPRSSSDSRS
ncbi:MAG TPA: hypothetical protein VLW26_03355 [Steroidobacteraceae bacterium]|nr:hypothetical protein [Steroidobacteraceae bacterium]